MADAPAACNIRFPSPAIVLAVGAATTTASLGLPPQICSRVYHLRSASQGPHQGLPLWVRHSRSLLFVWISHHCRQKANMVAFCDRDFDPMTFIYEFNLYPSRRTCRPKLNFLDKGFRKLSYYRHTDKCYQNYYDAILRVVKPPEWRTSGMAGRYRKKQSCITGHAREVCRVMNHKI